MKLSAPTIWDDSLLETFSRAGLDEVRGKADAEFRTEHSGHIRRVRGKGISFNYLIDDACLDNREWSRSWQKRTAGLLGRIADSGADRVTVSVPYLLELIRRRFPHFRINVSARAHIDSPARAVFWLGLGAASLTLSDTGVNRDFTLIKSIRAAAGCELRMAANNACLAYCPFSFHHSVFSAHAGAEDRGAADYDLAACRRMFFSDPALLLKACWIRPEDAGFYASLGVDTLELSGREMPAGRLKRVINAYSLGRHDGDLMELFPWKTLPGAYACPVRIENAGLDGFIERLYARGCGSGVSCGECRFCAEKARETVKYDENERLRAVRSHEELLKSMSGGGTGRDAS